MAMVSRSFSIIKSNNNNKDRRKGHIAAAKAIHKKYAPKVHEQAKKIRAAMARLMELEDEISGEPTLQDVDCGITTAYASFDIHSDKDSVGADDEGAVSFEAALGMIEDVIRDSAPKDDEDGYDSSLGDDDEGGEEDEGEEVVEIEDDDE